MTMAHPPLGCLNEASRVPGPSSFFTPKLPEQPWIITLDHHFCKKVV